VTAWSLFQSTCISKRLLYPIGHTALVLRSAHLCARSLFTCTKGGDILHKGG